MTERWMQEGYLSFPIRVIRGSLLFFLFFCPSFFCQKNLGFTARGRKGKWRPALRSLTSSSHLQLPQNLFKSLADSANLKSPRLEAGDPNANLDVIAGQGPFDAIGPLDEY